MSKVLVVWIATPEGNSVLRYPIRNDAPPTMPTLVADALRAVPPPAITISIEDEGKAA